MQKFDVRKKSGPFGLCKFVSIGSLFLGASVIPYGYALALGDNALPSGASVVGGSADFDYSVPNELHINQHSDLAYINWNSFNIGTNALTQFHQPGVTSIAVNKVTGTFEPSQILGTLKANGQVVILDQNGVIFGHDSKIDVGGIVASTGDIDATTFMSGSTSLQITGIDTGGSIINNGTITVGEAGLAAFVAPNLINNGLIQAKLGRVILASGTAATVDLYGDGLVEVAPSMPLQEALIQNTGTISAEGGTIVMTAATARGVVDSVINTSGLVNVSSATEKGGKIILEGPSIEVSGTLDASGKKGGGTVHVGGEWQGGGTTREAKTTTVTKDAVIKANATGADGDGGEVVLWSTDQTVFAGKIEAKGGSVSGDGGQVETSSKSHLKVDADSRVDVAAGNGIGDGGEWLIDPEDIVISDSGDDGNGATSDIATATINATLNGGGSITIATSGVPAGNGDITLSSANILKTDSTNNGSLTLQAHRNIVVTNSTINNTSTKTMDVTFIADNMLLTNSTVTANGVITLKPLTATTNINLGGPTGGFDLSDAELAMFNAGTLIIGDSTGTNYGDMIVDSWDLSGKTHNVELYANDITFRDTDAGASIDYAFNLGTGNLLMHAIDKDTATIDKALLRGLAQIKKGTAGSSTVTLRSDNRVSLEGGSHIKTTDGALNIILNSDRDADQDGQITVSTSEFTTRGGYVVMGGGSGAIGGTNGILGDGDGTGADDVAAWGNSTDVVGINLGNTDISTGIGAIILNGHAWNDSAATGLIGLNIATGSILETTTGRIQATGTGGNGGNGGHGISIGGAAGLTSEKGAITVKGTAASNGSSVNGYGVAMSGGNAISSTGTGLDAATIRIEGSSPNGHGVIISTGGIVSSKRGKIDVIGTITSFSTGIMFWDGGKILTDGDATIELTGITGGTGEIGGGNGVMGMVGGDNATGNIIVNANFPGIELVTLKTTGNVTIKPRTASRNINLGGPTGGMDLNDTELANILAGKLIIGDSANTTGDIVVDSWDLSGKAFDVELYGNDITFQDTDATVGVDYAVNLGTGNFMAHAIDKDTVTVDKAQLSVNAQFKKTIAGTSLLDLRSDRDIVFTSGNLDASTGGPLNVVLNADRDADQDGRISLTSSAITTNGGYAVLGGGSGTVWGADGIEGTGDDAASTGADKVAAWGNTTSSYGIYLSNGDVSTGNGSVVMNGHGYNNASGGSQYGLYALTNSYIQSTGGSITINATGGSGNDNNDGIRLEGAGTGLYSTNGNINLTGTSAGTGTTALDGILLFNGSGIETAGTGDIYLTGTSTLSGTHKGVRLFTGNSFVRATGGGNITITGTTPDGQDIELGTGSLTTSGGTSQGDITLIGDSLSLGASTINAADKLTIKTRTVSRNIFVGGPTGGLDLSDSLLSSLTADTLIIGDNTGASYGDMTVDSWDLSGKTFGVELYANDITFQDTDATMGVDYAVNLGTGNFMAHAIDKDTATVDKALLSVNAAILKSVAGTSLLDLRSDRDIVFSVGNITASGTGILNTVLNADRDADQDGYISLTTSAFDTNGGYAVLGGGSGTVGGTNGILGDGDGTGADDVAAWGNTTLRYGIELNNGDIKTNSGKIFLTGHGRNSAFSLNYGLYIYGGSRLESTSGSITLTGTGGVSTGSSNMGIRMLDAGTRIQSETGAIKLTGVANSDGAVGSTSNFGILIGSPVVIESLGLANDASSITIHGTGGAGGGNDNVGTYLSGSTITSTKGAIDITGIGAGTASNNHGVFQNSAIIESKGSATITITGQGLNGNDLHNSSTGNSVGGISATGTITFNVDTIALSNFTGQTTNNIIVKPRNTSTNINLGSPTGGLDLSDAELAMFNAGTLIIGDSANGSGDIDIDSWDLSSKSHHVQLFGNDIDIGGITTGSGNVYMYAKDGAITVSADSTSNAAGNLTLLAGRDVNVNEDLINADAGKINIFAGWDNTSGITTNALFNLDDIDLSMTARDITLGANGQISSGGVGTSVLLVASDDFINNATAGANAITAANGRYLVYASNPSETIKGGLTAKNLYNRVYDTSAPSSITGASRFVFAYQPTLTLKADDLTVADPMAAVYSFSATSGLVSGDILGDAVSGAGSYSLGALSGNTYPIIMAAGSLSSPMGYALAFTNGTMTVNAPPPSAPTPEASSGGSSIVSIINHTTNVPKVAMPHEQSFVTISDQVISIAEMNNAIVDNPAVSMGKINMGKDGMGGDGTTNSTKNNGSHEAEKKAKDAASQEPAGSEQGSNTADCLISDAATGGCIVH